MAAHGQDRAHQGRVTAHKDTEMINCFFLIYTEYFFNVLFSAYLLSNTHYL